MLKKLFRFAFFASLTYGFGMLARQLFLGLGDETTNEFELVTIMDGKEFDCRADALWSGKVTTVMGAMDIDLRDAELASDGADLAIFTVFGAISLRVPDTWIVETDGLAIAGEHDLHVADPAVLPEDSPVLRIQARTYFGSLAITAKPIEV